LEKKEKEIQIVKNFLHNNQYNATITNVTYSDKMIQNKEQGEEEDKQGDNNKEKWITLTYCGKEMKYLAKLLKGTNVKRPYKISNTSTIEKILGYKNDGRER
jgi:hypothetical protein